MFGKLNNGAPSGPALLLKSIGIDPAEIMGNIEAAKTTAQQVMTHFDTRLQTVETRLAAIESRQLSIEAHQVIIQQALTDTNIVLGQVLSELKILTQQNATQHQES